MRSNDDEEVEYEPLPDSRPTLAYALLAVIVASIGVLALHSFIVWPLLKWIYE